jgi:hypothetical protein
MLSMLSYLSIYAIYAIYSPAKDVAEAFNELGHRTREAESVTGARDPIAGANRLLTPDGVAIWAFRLRAVVGLAMILRKME